MVRILMISWKIEKLESAIWTWKNLIVIGQSFTFEFYVPGSELPNLKRKFSNMKLSSSPTFPTNIY